MRLPAPLCLSAADRLVRTVGERGAVPVGEAAGILLALAPGPSAVARRVLTDVVAADARLVISDGHVRLEATPAAATPLGEARFCVLDLETTGLESARARVCEIGAVLLRGSMVEGELELGATSAAAARAGIRRLLAFAGDAVLAGHNLRFDLAFLDREASRVAGGRLAAPIVDTLPLARRLLRDRAERFTLAALAEFVGTSEAPAHRALPDARATAEVLRFLLDVACERGARTVADVCALARMPIRNAR